MTGSQGASLRAAAVLALALWSAACGVDDGSGDPAPTTTVVIAVSESRTAPAMGETRPSGIFVVVRYVLANGTEEDVKVSRGDFTIVMPDGAALSHSEPGIAAWGEAPGGYELTESVLLKPGGMPRPWVSVFDVPERDAPGPWALRYRDEPPVGIPAPASK